MKRFAALFLVLSLSLALVPAAMANDWYSYEECMYCGLQKCYCSYYEACMDVGDVHHFWIFDIGTCTNCGSIVYDGSYYYATGEHEYSNGVCKLCGHVGSGNGSRTPVGGYSRKVFVCTDSVSVRSEPGSSGALYETAHYGDTFEYVRTVEHGYDGDPWFEVRYNGMTAYIPGGTRNSQFWLYRRACEIRLYNSPKSLSITGETNLVKNPDACTGDNEKGSLCVTRGWNYTCYGEVEDELYPSRVWYLVKDGGSWFFVPSRKASVK